MFRRTIIATAAVTTTLATIACSTDFAEADATDRAAETTAADSGRPHPHGPPSPLGAIVHAADHAANLDDVQRSSLGDIMENYGRAAKHHALAKDSVHAALAAGASECIFDDDAVSEATAAAATSAAGVGTAEVAGLDALHGLLDPTQRALVVAAALGHQRHAPPPRRPLLRSLARSVELTDEQLLAAADALGERGPASDVEPDPTALVEAFAGESFSAARFDLVANAQSRAEVRGQRLISTLEVLCPLLEADQRVALADALVDPPAGGGKHGKHAGKHQ